MSADWKFWVDHTREKKSIRGADFEQQIYAYMKELHLMTARKHCTGMSIQDTSEPSESNERRGCPRVSNMPNSTRHYS
jgi:hypothetical protein